MYSLVEWKLLTSIIKWIILSENDNHLKLNISETHELVVDCQRNRRSAIMVVNQEDEVKRVDSYKCLDWTNDTEAFDSEAQNRLT